MEGRNKGIQNSNFDTESLLQNKNKPLSFRQYHGVLRGKWRNPSSKQERSQKTKKELSFRAESRNPSSKQEQTKKTKKELSFRAESRNPSSKTRTNQKNEKRTVISSRVEKSLLQNKNKPKKRKKNRHFEQSREIPPPNKNKAKKRNNILNFPNFFSFFLTSKSLSSRYFISITFFTMKRNNSLNNIQTKLKKQNITTKSKTGAFTLVELIATISIVSVLTIVAFLNIQKWLSNSRDSKRLTAINQIHKSLEIGYIETAKYPIPDRNQKNRIYVGTIDDTELFYQ